MLIPRVGVLSELFLVLLNFIIHETVARLRCEDIIIPNVVNLQRLILFYIKFIIINKHIIFMTLIVFLSIVLSYN